MDVEKFEIAKMDIKPGDIVVLRFERGLPADAIRSVREQVQGLLPEGVKVMVLADEPRLGILRPFPVVEAGVES